MGGQGGADMRFVRRDCINACEGLIKKIDDDLPLVNIGMEGLYYSGRNKFKDSTEKEKRSAGDRGTKLVIELGCEGRDTTVYAMALKDLNAKSRTRSLRFDGQPGAPGVTASISRLGDVEVLEDIQEKLFRSTSLAANSMSFGAMLEGSPDPETGKPASWLEDGLAAGSLEHLAAEEMLGLGMAGRWDGVLEAAKGGDPIKSMAAWAVTAYKLEGRLDDGTEPLDPNDPRLADLAGHAMGLDALYDGLSRINDKMLADQDYVPDLNEVLNPDAPKGQAALRGLMCLAMYKEVKDRGGKDMTDDAGRPVIGIDAGHMAVYDRMAFTRSDAESLQKSYQALEQRRAGFARTSCVQSTFAGIDPEAGQAPKAEIRKFDQYRFYRYAMLGERPDMPSNVPDLRLEARPGADIRKLSAENIVVKSIDLPADMPRMSLKDFLDGAASGNEACKSVTDRLPAIARELRTRGGVDRLCQSATEIVKKSENAYANGMVLEMASFLEKKSFDKRMNEPGKDGRSESDIESEFAANFERSYGKAPQLMREINRAAGMPDFDFGQLRVGSMWLADIKANTPNLDRIAGPDFMGGGGRAETKAALAFWHRDIEMRAVIKTVEECSVGDPPRSMQEAAAALPEFYAAGEFTRQLGRYLEIQNSGPENLEKGAMMLNDFLVLSGTYNITSREGLEDLARDIDIAYGPDAGKEKLLYRPVDRAEKNALAAIYSSGTAGLDAAKVEFRSQGSPAGFLTAAWNGLDGRLDDLAAKEDAMKILETAALDQDTFTDRHYSKLAGMLDGPRRTEAAMHVIRQDEQARHGSELDPNRQLGG